MLRDLRLVSVAESFSRIASFATIPLLTNALVPSEYGVYRSMFVLTSLLLLVRGVLNLSPLILKRLPELADSERRSLIASTTLLFAGLMTLVAVVLPIVTYADLLGYVSDDLQVFVDERLLLVTLLVVSTAWYRFGLTLCKGLDEFDWFGWIKILHEAVFLLGILGLFWLQQLSVLTAITSYLAAHLIAVTLLVIPLRGHLIGSPGWTEFSRSFKRISAPLIPRTIIKKAKTVLPDILILSSFGSGVFGAWSVVFAFVTVFQFYSQPFSQLLLPKISQRLSDGQPLSDIAHRYYRLMLLLTIPAVMGGWLVGDEIIRYVFGGGYVLDPYIIAIILTAFGLQTMNTLAGPVFVATDRSIYATYLQAITAVTLLSLIIVGTLVVDSLLVVASGYLLENAVALALAFGYQRRVIDFSLPSPGAVVKVGLALLAMLTAVYVLAAHISSLLQVIAVTGTGAVIYFTVLAVSGFFTSDDISLLTRFVGFGA